MKSLMLAVILFAVASLMPANIVLADGGTLILGVEADQGRIDYSMNPSLVGTNTVSKQCGKIYLYPHDNCP